MKSDVFWSLFAMPIGVAICFGPAIVAWLLAGKDSDADEETSTAPVPKH